MPIAPLVQPENDNPLAIAWKAIQTLVRENANLKAKVKTFRLMDGDVDEWQSPTIGECPWLRIMPSQTPTMTGSESEWEFDFRISYELAVAGTRAADIINLCGMFYGAMSQSTSIPLGTVLPFYRSKGIRYIEVVKAAIGIRVPRPNSNEPPMPYLYAQGEIRLDLYLEMIDNPPAQGS